MRESRKARDGRGGDGGGGGRAGGGGGLMMRQRDGRMMGMMRMAVTGVGEGGGGQK